MIHRVNKCFGIPIWKWNKTYAEIWICFSGVEPHIHPGQHSEIIPIFGWSTFFRVTPEGEKQELSISPKRWFHAFSVPADWQHWFSGWPLVFLNVSDRCAATNLQYT